MCPSNLLQCPVQVSLNYWPSRFVVAAHPPMSVSNLLTAAGLYRECQKYDPNCPNFTNRKDPTFKELNSALQLRYKKLRESVGTIIKHTTVVLLVSEPDPLRARVCSETIVLPDEELALWESKVVGDHDPLRSSAESCVPLCRQDFLSESWLRAKCSQALPVYPLFNCYT